jgi:hypothetical protein
MMVCLLTLCFRERAETDSPVAISFIISCSVAQDKDFGLPSFLGVVCGKVQELGFGNSFTNF